MPHIACSCLSFLEGARVFSSAPICSNWLSQSATGSTLSLFLPFLDFHFQHAKSHSCSDYRPCARHVTRHWPLGLVSTSTMAPLTSLPVICITLPLACVAICFCSPNPSMSILRALPCHLSLCLKSTQHSTEHLAGSSSSPKTALELLFLLGDPLESASSDSHLHGYSPAPSWLPPNWQT